jgi:hypothetical protein
MEQHRVKCLVAAATAFFWTASAMAMYTPNPAGRWAPNQFTLAGDMQFNPSKDLDINHGGSHELHDMFGMFVRPSYSIARNITIHGRLGFQTANDVDTDFAGGFGVQGAYVLPRAREWAIGGAFDFLHWSASGWDEFQLTPAASYKVPEIPTLTPYAGMMFDFVDGNGFSESDPVGLLFGTNFDPNEHVRLDGQFRLISEYGFLFSIAYMF